MRSKRLTLVAAMAVVMVVATPLTVLAQELVRGDFNDTGQSQERPTDRVRLADQAVDGSVDGSKDIPSDRPNDRREETSRRCHDRVTDEVRDCAQVHRCLRPTDNPRRCIDVKLPPDLDIRHLIWRLIHAHEWELLHRLLHWLGF